MGEVFTAGGSLDCKVVLLGALLVAFVLARRSIASGWPIAAASGVAFALRSLLAGPGSPAW